MPKKVRILDFSDTTANILEYIVKFSNDGKLYLWFLFWLKNKKKSKVEAFSLWRENKIIWTPTNNWWWVINESFATKRLFRYVRKWKKSDRTTILIVTNLNYFTFLTYFYTFIRIFNYFYMLSPVFQHEMTPFKKPNPSKSLVLGQEWLDW